MLCELFKIDNLIDIISIMTGSGFTPGNILYFSLHFITENRQLKTVNYLSLLSLPTYTIIYLSSHPEHTIIAKNIISVIANLPKASVAILFYLSSSLSKEDKLTHLLPLEGGGLRWW